MNGTRMVVFFLGVFLVIAAVWMLLVQTGLSRWIPAGVAAAAILLFVGAAMMGASEKVPSERHEHVEHTSGPAVVEEHHHH